MLTFKFRPQISILAYLAIWSTLIGCCIVLGLNLALRLKGKMKVIIDTDAGVDDAMAMFLLLSTNADILGITTVTGNTGAGNVSRNVIRILQTTKRMDIAVYVGSEDNTMGDWQPSGYFGWDGFGDLPDGVVPDESPIRKEHAAVFLAQAAHEYPGQITLLSIGPLTNLAMAAHINSRFLIDLKEIIILGGSYQGTGNMRPGIEFNIGTDPEAASFVFSKVPPSLITLLPIETLQRNSFSMTWRKEVLGGLKSEAMKLLNEAEASSLKDNKWVCFDPTAAALIIDRNIVKATINGLPLIEVEGRVGRGFMIQDLTRKVVTIVVELDKGKLKSLLLHLLS